VSPHRRPNAHLARRTAAPVRALPRRPAQTFHPHPVGVSSHALTLALAFVLVSDVLTACTPSVDSSHGNPMRDSSGVRIVENQAPAWASGASWYLEDTPTVAIGVAEGPEPYQLFRVFGAARLTDHRIVVGNAGSFELRLFDADGHFLGSAGRAGDGPGEFHIPYLLVRTPGDTLLVFDFSPQRITVYDGNLSLLGTRAPRGTGNPTFAAIFGRLSSGMMVGVGSGSDEPAEQGSAYRPAAYLRYSPDGDLLDTIAMAPGWDTYRVEVTVRGQRGFSPQTPPFGRVAQYTLYSDQILVGNGDTYEIQVFAEDGELRTLIRLDREPIAVTPEHVASYRKVRLAQLGSSRFTPAWERAFADMPVASTLPAFDSLLADAEGNLWVREYQIDGHGARQWDVFDPGGRWLGTTTTPSGLHVFEIGSDYILGVSKDELGVERVQLYALIKP
jgi:hypothetical protein